MEQISQLALERGFMFVMSMLFIVGFVYYVREIKPSQEANTKAICAAVEAVSVSVATLSKVLDRMAEKHEEHETTTQKTLERIHDRLDETALQEDVKELSKNTASINGKIDVLCLKK